MGLNIMIGLAVFGFAFGLIPAAGMWLEIRERRRQRK